MTQTSKVTSAIADGRAFRVGLWEASSHENSN